MKQIEVRLSLSVVAPLLDAVRMAADTMTTSLAVPLDIEEMDEDMRDFWKEELVANQNGDIGKLMGLFGSEFFGSGVVTLDEENADPILRACAALRLRLRDRFLKHVSDEALESGELEVDTIEEPLRKAFMGYLFLATIQDLILQHLENGSAESGEGA